MARWGEDERWREGGPEHGRRDEERQWRSEGREEGGPHGDPWREWERGGAAPRGQREGRERGPWRGGEREGREREPWRGQERGREEWAERFPQSYGGGRGRWEERDEAYPERSWRESRRPPYGAGGTSYGESYGDPGTRREHSGYEDRDHDWRRQGYPADYPAVYRERHGGDAERHYGREDERGLGERLKEGMRKLTGRGPKGYKRSDERIREDVCERIARSWVASENVEVTVQGGEVTLAGTVERREDKRILEDVAEDVFGVEEVHNHLRVDRGQTTATAGTTMTQGGTSTSAQGASSQTTGSAARPGAPQPGRH